ncbi:MAG TPA: tannase/feruloyl esterase family alpha/beta hydrolase [Bryobacteraceae bacterium]|nr:tannase/feruloyl esterase family alpha/beta hydrolase [Bryobacteraceae bacterium]
MTKNFIRFAPALIAAFPICLAAQQSCESLTGLTLPHTTITSAVTVPAATAMSMPVPAHCDVKATARPTRDSEIKFEVWLPASGWNGKYEQVGNGGWAGSIPVGSFAEPLRRGYAVAGTDDGHSGGSAAWAIGHPEKMVDFGYRAVHETSLQASAIVHALYGKDPARSYFVGCSDGGREALMESQRFADDFDGIIAGAPAGAWSQLVTGHMWDEHALLMNPESSVPPAKLKAIQKAAIEQCDALDGLKDGLIEDPRVCHFDPSVILCKGADSPECLTAPQVEAVKKIYAGPKNPRTGAQIAPGFSPGAEGEAGTWAAWITNAQPKSAAQFGFANTYYGQAVYEDPKWDYHDINFDKDFAYGDAKVGSVINAVNPDLRSFRARGGKLIQFHGWGDPALPPVASIQYHDQVHAFLAKYPDGRSDKTKPVEDFYRLFMVPGMGHCSGGAGANSFGNVPRGGADIDPDHDILSALDRWVEKGVAPDKIIASGKSVADPSKPLTRPLCVYPATAHYKGSGDPNDAANFSCVAPK